MKVLWFTNTPSLAADFLNVKVNGQGWISSLEKQIGKVKNIELGIAFPDRNGEKKRFEVGTTSYFSFPVQDKKGRIGKLKDRWKYKIEPDTIIKHFLEIVKEFNPDVIHIFGTEHAYGLMIPYLKVPAVIQIQGNLTVVSKKWFSGISSINILRFSNFRTLILAYGLRHYYFLFVKNAKREQKIFNSCKNFIGRTDWDRRITRVLSPNSVYFHCDELLRDVFYKTTWTQLSNRKMVFFSTLGAHTYKGLETILETASLLKNNGIFDFEWRIAGVNGKEEIIRIIEKTYKLRFIEQNILFQGSLDADELVKGLLRSNYYIHPSHIENSPNSICEAMLLGMPVIATYAGGIPSIVSDKHEGILVQDGDPYALAGAIIELAEDREMGVKIGKNARERALKRHDPQKIIDDLSNIYSALISRNIMPLA